jgi:segregation and condensation protein B
VEVEGNLGMESPDPKPEELPDSTEPKLVELGESYAALIGNQTWELDAESDLLSFPTLPNEEITQPAPSFLPENKSSPLAESSISEDSPPSPQQIVEAMLFVGGIPLLLEKACQIVRGLSQEQFREIVEELNRTYRKQNRPYFIESNDQGYFMTIRAKYRDIRERLYGGPREARLTQPAQDVLSLVAYRQPITKSEIDTLRGSDSSGYLRTLVRLGLIAIIQRADANQREVYYGTTPRFLETFTLRNLDDLPQIGESKRV